MARAVMLQGTGSDVGKTVLVAGLCRVASRRGLKVAPFKPQNMSNNAAVAGPDAEGLSGEIGRAQWLQAVAAGIEPSVHMNPVLLKPQSATGSQVVVQGRVMANASARDYQRLRPQLLEAVESSFRRLEDCFDLVVVEGAGSPAEINLRRGDIANMGFARRVDIPVVLVGDIDRGGVIASIVGTHAVLDSSDREKIAGFIINKFRGDVSLFDEGLEAIMRFTGWRSYGIVPWLDAVARLPPEDSVALERLAEKRKGARITIAVPVLPRIANFDDLDPLRAEPEVDLVYVRPGERMPEHAALVVLAGSKSTISDLAALRANGWARAIARHVERGGHVIGICGGLQMLGRTIDDPTGIEGDPACVEGLGLLDIETVIESEKTVRNSFAETDCGVALEGYEIHMGRTSGPDCARPMIRIDGRADGATSADGRVRGCYLHGLFNGDAYRSDLLRRLGASNVSAPFGQSIEDALDSLADSLERHLDIDGMLECAASPRERILSRFD